MVFRKDDNGKPGMAYLQWKQLEDVARVQDFGAAKYGRNNWHKSPSRMRYISAAFRHIGAFCMGERTDKESGLPHLAHAVCCLLFVMWMVDNGRGQED